MVRLSPAAGAAHQSGVTGVLITSAREAVRLSVTGVVQGVGFRPFVHRLALRHVLGGWVRNAGGEVEIEVEGPSESVAAFVRELTAEAPSLARIAAVTSSPAEPQRRASFTILPSTQEPDRRQPISPDVAMCAACERELVDPANRRYGYPFITCTDCGPRFTVIDEMPYDRERTSMRDFTQCPECRAEYTSPGHRRYHSQTNSCWTCGPRLWFESATEKPESAEVTSGKRALESAANVLRFGLIVAIRGLGGFHLAVDATNEEAVRRLRRRKARDAKPLAVMVATLDDAQRLGLTGPDEAASLTSSERPIVLLQRRPDSELAPSVAPGLDTVGVMTAYTPMHRLLLDLVGRPLVMTSGNLTDEPIATTNEDARRRLGGIADTFLLHNRDITARYDDSVVRVVDGAPVFLRRARGYAPLPLEMPIETPVPLVAVGPHLKNTFTLAQGRTAYVSQHIGDLESLETLAHLEETLDAYRRLFRVAPEVVVRDRHPGYLSSRLAEEMGLRRIMDVQHHHAHVAAVAAEHGVTRPVVGLAFDGTGYGDDGHIWGAEVLVADLVRSRRVGQLRYAPLPGGDAAVRRPWRVALGFLSLAPEAARAFDLALRGIPEREQELARRQVQVGLNAPLASSMGRLFDAAAAILGVCCVAHYEGQAAMELEALAGNRRASPLPFPVVDHPEGGWILDPMPLLIALGERRVAGHDPADLAAAFHESVAAATAQLADAACATHDTEIVALGGGVFQNARLLTSLSQRLEVRLLQVLTPRQLSPNDGAISYGQAAVAAARLSEET